MEDLGINVLQDILGNLNVWLVVLGTGLIMWIIRQVIPDAIENSKIWKVLLRIMPIFIGVGVALIPGLRPIDGNLTQSGAIGFIGGSLSQSVYDFFKSLMSKKMREMMASKAGRNAQKNSECDK